MSVTLHVPEAALTGSVITSRSFGVNYLFNRQPFEDGIGGGNFDELALDLGLKHLRYPGGTIAERQFNLGNPENTYQATDLLTGEVITNAAKHELTPLNDFLAFADASGASVSIVLPTGQYAQAVLGRDAASLAAVEAEVSAFVEGVLSGPYGASVELFELGNEWENAGFSTATDYGRVADKMAVWVQRAITASGNGAEPAIAVQSSARAARLNETAEIAAALSPEARAAIDAVIVHNYRPVPWEQGSTTEGKFNHVSLLESALGKDLTTVVSEWNVGNASDWDGLAQGAGLLEMFNQMARLGMDAAHVWPLFENNTTRLAEDPDSFYAGGEIFRQMKQSLPGMHALDITSTHDTDGDGRTDVLMHAYAEADQDGLVVFLASLSDQNLSLALDLSAQTSGIPQEAPVWLTQTGVVQGDDPLSPDATPNVHATRISPGPIETSLAPYQIARIEIAPTSVSVVDGQTGFDHLRLTEAAEVVRLKDDGVQDLVRGFSLGLDRLDVSEWGAVGMADLQITDLVRKDGSVSWIRVSDADGEAELALRFSYGSRLGADRLGQEHFIFASEPPPAPARAVVQDGEGFDDIRLGGSPEEVDLIDDGVRDLVRNFDLAEDVVDVSAWGIGRFGELAIRNLVRKDGSISWIALSDAQGDDEVFLRLVGTTDASLLQEDHFLFA